MNLINHWTSIGGLPGKAFWDSHVATIHVGPSSHISVLELEDALIESQQAIGAWPLASHLGRRSAPSACGNEPALHEALGEDRYCTGVVDFRDKFFLQKKRCQTLSQVKRTCSSAVPCVPRHFFSASQCDRTRAISIHPHGSPQANVGSPCGGSSESAEAPQACLIMK